MAKSNKKTEKSKKSNAGRKCKYHTHIEPNFDIILGWLRSGNTEESIAKSLGVAVSSWQLYKSKYSEFSELIKEGTQGSLALVVNSLYKKATGYEYEETHTEMSNNDGRAKQVIKKVKKQVAPDTGAIAIILFNRDPENWKNKQNIEHSGKIESTSGVLALPIAVDEDQWKQLAKQQQEILKKMESNG